MDAGQLAAQALGQRPLVPGVEVGEEQADRDRLAAARAHLLGQPLGLAVGQRLDLALGPDPPGRLEAQLGLDQRRRLGGAEPVELGPLLAADLEQVGEALGRDQRGAGAAFLEQGVGADRHPVGEGLDRGRLGAGPPQHLFDRADHAQRLVLGRRRQLRRVQLLAVEEHGVGEGAADVDAEQHQRHCSRRVVPSAASTMWTPSSPGSISGKSARRWPPRDSARSSAQVAIAAASG